jgi:hypothetical protein
MPALADILRQCRKVVLDHHPWSQEELVAAIDAELAGLAHAERMSAAGQRIDAAGRPLFPVSVRVQHRK